MKNRILLVMLCCIGFINTLKAQIILDTVFYQYPENHTLLRLEKSGYKWLKINHTTKDIKLLNMDYSLFRQFSFQADTNLNLTYQIGYFSEMLFDADSTDIEFLFDYSQWPSSNHYIKIWDEAGNMLFYRDSFSVSIGPSNTFSPNMMNQSGITNTDSGAFMILSSVAPPVRTEIYRLPGYYECSVCDNSFLKLQPLGVEPVSQKPGSCFLNVYPNPSNSHTKIEYQLPPAHPYGKIRVVDMNGRLVRSFDVSASSTSITIENNILQAGIYSCILEAGGQMVLKKIIHIE